MVISLAPGEGNIPFIWVYLWTETLNSWHSQQFFCGETRPDNKDRKIPVHYSTVYKWELRSQDRRVAQSLTKHLL